MSILDLTCNESTSFSKNCCTADTKYNRIVFGSNYYDDFYSYLYFKFPPYSAIKNLKSAKLILYKFQMSYDPNTVYCSCTQSYYYNDVSSCTVNNDYIVSPLLDYFSAYSCLFNLPKADFSSGVEFTDDIYQSYTEVDITSIVNSWITDKLENKGLLLMGKAQSELVSYASENFDVQRMRPTIRLIYTENHLPRELISVPCSIDIIDD